MQVTLSDNTVIEIDIEDVPLLQQADWRRDTESQTCRVVSFSGPIRREGRRYVSLARLIARVPARCAVRYHNDNPLDLRRANLWYTAPFRESASASPSLRAVGVASVPEKAIRGEETAKGFCIGAPTTRETNAEPEDVAPSERPSRRAQNRIPRWSVGTSHR